MGEVETSADAVERLIAPIRDHLERAEEENARADGFRLGTRPTDDDVDQANSLLDRMSARIRELEAKLDEAVEALGWISTEERLDHINGGLCLTDGAEIARATLTKLKRETDAE